MRRFLMTVMLGTACALLWNAQAGAEDIYRWVDESGTVHFGERPPEGVDATRVEVRESGAAPQPAPATAQAPADVQTPAKSVAQQRREERAKRREEQQAEQAFLDAKCEAMRQQLAAVEPHVRVIVTTEEGESRRLDDAERLEMIDEAKTFIAENCE